MSGFFAYTGEGELVVLSDGAVYESDVMVDFTRKISYSSAWPLAVSTRGASKFGEVVKRDFIKDVEADGFDEAIDQFEYKLDIWRDAPKVHPIEMIIAGRSEAEGLKMLFWCSQENYGYAPFEFHDVKFAPMLPMPDGWTLAGIGVDKWRPDELASAWLRRNGPTIFQCSRDHLVPCVTERPGEMSSIIGGHVDMAVVTMAGVKIERLHRWPDVVGRKINPALGRVVRREEPVANMNRQQRRAMKRRVA